MCAGFVAGVDFDLGIVDSNGGMPRRGGTGDGELEMARGPASLERRIDIGAATDLGPDATIAQKKQGLGFAMNVVRLQGVEGRDANRAQWRVVVGIIEGLEGGIGPDGITTATNGQNSQIVVTKNLG